MDSTQQPAAGAIHSDEAAASRPQSAGGRLLSRLEPGASLARHKRLALSLFLLISFAGLPVAWIKGRPAYFTQAVVYISPRFIRSPQGDEEFPLRSNPQYREYVQQNVRTINRLDVVQETLRKLGEKGKRWWYRPRENDRRAAERLAGALTITPVPDTCQVTVGLEGDQPQGLDEIVNTLIAVYAGVRKSEEFYGVDSRLHTLQQETDSLGKELADNQARRTELARELGVGAFTENHRRAEALDAEQIGKSLAAGVAQQESRASWFTVKYQEGISLGQRIEQARKRQESADERGRLLDLESKAPGFVSVFAMAQPAGQPVKGGRTKLALLFCLAGLAIAFLVPIAIDIADPRLLVPADAGRALGFDPLGWVPERTEGGEEFTWELILRLANRIHQKCQAHGTRIWMFTAVKSGGGTTTLVNSLGRALTLLGVPVLSVEANAYRADGSFARNATGLGLSVLLRGHSTLSESIETEDGEMPDHIPVGELDGTGRLPAIHRLMGILGEALESYALVLVDIPPVLASVDAEYLARRADCVVLVAEARHVSSLDLKRAARALERIQAKAVACVLNRVHAADGRGFAQNARREFETGAPKPVPAWQQP